MFLQAPSEIYLGRGLLTLFFNSSTLSHFLNFLFIRFFKAVHKIYKRICSRLNKITIYIKIHHLQILLLHLTERQSWMLPDLSVQMKTTNAPQLKIN